MIYRVLHTYIQRYDSVVGTVVGQFLRIAAASKNILRKQLDIK